MTFSKNAFILRKQTLFPVEYYLKDLFEIPVFTLVSKKTNEWNWIKEDCCVVSLYIERINSLLLNNKSNFIIWIKKKMSNHQILSQVIKIFGINFSSLKYMFHQSYFFLKKVFINLQVRYTYFYAYIFILLLNVK